MDYYMKQQRRGEEGVWLMLKILLVLILIYALTGCADWGRETKMEEVTYQTLGVVDTIQSYQGARRPECYQESDPVTSFVVGNHPRPGSVIAWGIARAGLHAYVTDWMVHDDASPAALRIWEGLTIGVEAVDVGRNWRVGLRFGTARPPSYAPCLRSTT